MAQDKAFFETLKNDFNEALAKGWELFPQDPDYVLLKDFFYELAGSGFFEQKFRGKIPNPAHDFAVRLMGKHINEVCAKHGVVFAEFFPGSFHTSTGEEIKNDPEIPVYEHRNFHNTLWKDGRPMCDIVITISHIRGKFEFPKVPYVTMSRIYA